MWERRQKKAGAIQADMLQNAWKENQKKLDHNKNNTARLYSY